MTENTALIPVQLQVTVTPAKIDTNIEPLRLALIEKIDNQSKTVITLENLQEGKNLAAEINKTKKLIADERKRVAGEATANVKPFEEQMKALEKICDDGYGLLKRQTDEFDATKKAEHLQIIKDALSAAWEAAGIDPEFRRAVVDDLASLTAVTPKGSLTKTTKTTLDSRVAEDKSLQDRTNMRLVLLENQSLKAGLVAPLDRNHVAAFLFAPDDVYQKRLDAIIQSEIQRQQAAQDKARNDQLAEQARAAQQAQAQAQQVASTQSFQRDSDNVLSVADDRHQPVVNITEQVNDSIQANALQQRSLGAQLKVNHPAFGAEQKDQFGAALNGAQQGKPMTCTQPEFEQHVIGLSSAADGFFEIYSRSSGLVAIVKNGVLFRKVDA
jgi:type II secretory pathway pseudopilin PulG